MKRIFTLLALSITVGAFADNPPIPVYDEIDYRILSEEAKTVEIFANHTKPEGRIRLPSELSIEGMDYKVTRIAKNGFKNCDKITQLILPDYLESIGAFAFSMCGELKSMELPPTLKRIEDFAFSDCESLDSVGFPEGIEEIGSFSGCKSLTNVVIPSSVTGAINFRQCSNLKTVVIGKNVSELNWAFEGDCELTTVYTMSATPQEDWRKAFVWWYHRLSATDPRWEGKTNVYVPEESLDAYRVLQEPAPDEYGYTYQVDLNYYPLPAAFIVFSMESYKVESQESVQLHYRVLNPGGVTIVSAEWEAFNPRAVEVTDGVAKGLSEGERTCITLTLTDTDGNQYFGECFVEVIKNTEVNTVSMEEDATVEFFTITGIPAGTSKENLSRGIYIRRQGNESSKIIVK